MSLKDSLLFPAIQSVHLVGIALLLGAILIVDLHRLGLALPRHDTSAVRQRFAPWARTGLVVMLTTGPVLFAADVTRYLNNPAFLLKMVILLVALAFHFTMHARSAVPAKWIALVSMTLWTCVVLSGRAIADFDI